jgi:hypothetical protein
MAAYRTVHRAEINAHARAMRARKGEAEFAAHACKAKEAEVAS